MLSDCEQLTIANIHWQTKDVGAITNHKWIVSLQISLFPSHRKAYMYDLIARQISQLAVDRILKDNLPKTCAAANISLSTCRVIVKPVEDIQLSWKMNGLPVTSCSVSSASVRTVMGKKKHPIVKRGVDLFWCMSQRGYSASSEV